MYTTWRRRNEVQKSRSPEVQKFIIQKSSSQKKWKMKKSSFSFPSPPILVLPISVLFTLLYYTNCIAL